MFYIGVRDNINLAVAIFAIVLQAVAFVHCLLQRSEAFPALGTLPKPGWLAILGIGTVFSVVALSGSLWLFVMIGIAAASVYLLDVRPGLRDVADGRGPW